jgi:hypothetical protein
VEPSAAPLARDERVGVASVLASSWDELRESRNLRLGVTGALLLYTGLVMVWVFCVPLFGPADERAHVDYAWQVAHGHLPVAGSPFTAEFPELGQVSYVQHVSNHPPLYYVIVGPVLRFAAALGHPAAGLYTLRLVNAAITCITILVIARLAAVIAAGAHRQIRDACVIAACVLAAVNPALVAASGAIQNDPLAILFAALVALALARAARNGVDARTVAWLALLCTAGTLTRVTFITVTAIAVAGTISLSLWPELRPRRQDLSSVVRAMARGSAIAGATAVGAGWFLLLNLHRYGDLTGGSAVYHLESVQERSLAPGAAHGPVVYLLHPYTWWVQFLQLVAPTPSIANDSVPYVAMTVALIVLLAVGAVAFVRRRGAGLVDRPALVALLLLVVLFAASMCKLAVHVSNRGGANQRYLLDALGLWAVGGTLLVLALGRLARHAIPLLGAFGAVGTVCYAAGIVARSDKTTEGSTPHVLRTSLADSIVPAAEVVLAVALLLVVAGLAMSVTAMAREQLAEEDGQPERTIR